jgi:hypothetical protein
MLQRTCEATRGGQMRRCSTQRCVPHPRCVRCDVGMMHMLRCFRVQNRNPARTRDAPGSACREPASASARAPPGTGDHAHWITRCTARQVMRQLPVDVGRGAFRLV